MSKNEGAERNQLDEDLSALARERAGEVEAWWTAAERADPSLLPDGAPPLEVLRPLDEGERGRVASALFGISPISAVETGNGRWWSDPPWRKLVPSFALAIAAAVTMFALTFDPAKTPPQYTLTVSGGDQELRSSDAAPSPSDSKTLPQYTDGSRMVLVFQPEVATAETVGVRAFVVGARVLPWPAASIQRGESGTFKIVAELGRDLHLEPGAWRLVFFVGSPEALPSDPNDSPRGEVQRLEYAFQLQSMSR